MDKVLLVLVIVLFIIVVVLIGTVVKLVGKIGEIEKRQKKLKNLFTGESVEELLYKTLKQQEVIAEEFVKLKNEIMVLEEKQKYNIDRVGLIRYPATGDKEAKLSYSVGFSNEAGDGIVITGLYFRQGVNMYFKHVKEGVPDYTLTDEEKKVLQRTRLDDITEREQ